MNLADNFEPLAPRPDGLQRVRRTARSRAITRKLSSGTAMLMLVILATGTLVVADSWYYDLGSERSLSDTSSTAGVSSAGTAGEAEDRSLLDDWMIWAFALGLLILLATVIASIVHERRSETPLLRFPFAARIGLTVGLAIVAVPTAMAIASRFS